MAQTQRQAARSLPAPAVPLRPLGAAELLDGAVRAVRNNARASFAIALPVAAAHVAVVSWFQLDTLGGGTVDRGFAFPQLLAQLLAGGVFGVLLAGLLAPLYTDELLGTTRLSVGGCLRRVGRRWLPLVGLAVLVAVAQTVGVALLFVGGAWLWGVWALAGPALVAERLGPLRAVSRSFDLVRNGFWRVWGVRALAWLATTALSALVTLPFIALASYLGDTNPFDTGSRGIGDPGLYVTITALGSLLALTVLSPVTAAVENLLYLDARMRREGMDIAIALGADEASEPAPAVPPAQW